MIDPSEISILIPGFERPEMTRRVILAALATGAGEVIYSEDPGRTGLRDCNSLPLDPRLKYYFQEKRLGLWPNHYFLLTRATRSWVKFWQTDDVIEPWVISKLAELAESDIAIISFARAEVFEDSSSISYLDDVPEIMKFSSDEYLHRALWVSNELETPSNSLIQKKFLPMDEAVWKDDLSVDWIYNIHLASNGTIILLPGGGVKTVDHPNRDTQTSGYQVRDLRLANSLAYFSASKDERIARLAPIYSLAELISLPRTILGRWRRGHSTSMNHNLHYCGNLIKISQRFVPRRDWVSLIYLLFFRHGVLKKSLLSMMESRHYRG